MVPVIGIQGLIKDGVLLYAAAVGFDSVYRRHPLEIRMRGDGIRQLLSEELFIVISHLYK